MTFAASASENEGRAQGSSNPLRFATFLPLPDTPDALADIVAYARRIEQAGFSALLIGDDASLGSFEPLTLTAALSMFTDRIGLVPTAATDFNEPFHVARRLASIDHMAGGRAGWHVDTHAVPREAGGFFPRRGDDHDDRLAQAEEFLSIARGLWDSYADDAIVVDRRSGMYFRPSGRRPINHVGSHFRVAGPLNLARSPQAHPVIFHSPVNQDEIAFAARNADVVLAPVLSIEAAETYRAGLDRAVIAAGRIRGSAQFWPRIRPVIAAHEHEIGTRREELKARPEATDGNTFFIGTPDQLADHIAQWAARRLADGVAFHFPLGLADASAFLDEALPVLSRRGLIAPPDGTSLRDGLGLSRPERSAA